MVKNKNRYENFLAIFLAVSLIGNVVLAIDIFNLQNQNIILSAYSNSNQQTNTQTTLGTNKPVDSAPVNIAIVSDKRCLTCDVSGIIRSLQSLFPTASIKQLDYSESSAVTLISSTGVKYLPAVFFDNTVKGAAGYTNIQSYLVSAGNYYSLNIGASWDPYCDASQVNCGDVKCKDRVSCRPSIPEKLDLFVMSRCPYGVQAETALNEFLSSVKNVTLDINFIASYDPATGSFSSLHGDAEVQDDIKELCVKKYYPSNLMSFITCRNKDFNADASLCYSGMDAAKIVACSSGQEGKDLLKQSIAITTALNVQASPTFMVNNKVLFNAVTANDIKTAYCKSNNVIGCDKQLTNTSAVSGNC